MVRRKHCRVSIMVESSILPEQYIELSIYKSSPGVGLPTLHRCFNIFEQPITIMKYVIVTVGVMSGIGKRKSNP